MDSQNYDRICLENEFAWEEGRLPSNPFWILKRALELLISNRISSFKSVNDNFSYSAYDIT